MENQKLYSIGLYLHSTLKNHASERVLQHFMIKNGTPYLRSFSCNLADEWWAKYKNFHRAEKVLKRIMRNCNEVVGAFIFDSVGKNTYNCYARFYDQIICVKESQFKHYLSTYFNIKWKSDLNK